MPNNLRRRKFFAACVVLGAVLFTPHSLLAATKPALTLPAVTHSVYFWLKEPDNETHKAQLIEGLQTLRAIDTVRAIQIGVPAPTMERGVIDASYQVSELLFFDTTDDQDSYQKHPVHQEFIKQYSHLWSKVVVYDSIGVDK